MSKKLFFGSNLKMYKNIKDTVSYLQELESLTKDISRDEIELFIIPSYTTLDSASKAIDQKNIRLGAQNMCWEEQGQFTGEISPLMLQEAGIGLVMIGHSERRHVFGDYILWDIFIENMTASLPFIMTPVAVNMDKTIRWLERQVMPSLLMIKEIEKETGANYLEAIDRQTRLTDKQELKIKQMTTDISDVIIG